MSIRWLGAWISSGGDRPVSRAEIVGGDVKMPGDYVSIEIEGGNMSDNGTKNGENKNSLQLPPKDLTYRVLMERSAQIKAGDSNQQQQQNTNNTSKNIMLSTEELREYYRQIVVELMHRGQDPEDLHDDITLSCAAVFEDVTEVDEG